MAHLRRYRNHVRESMSKWTLASSLLIGSWWVKIPNEDFSDRDAKFQFHCIDGKKWRCPMRWRLLRCWIRIGEVGGLLGGGGVGICGGGPCDGQGWVGYLFWYVEIVKDMKIIKEKLSKRWWFIIFRPLLCFNIVKTGTIAQSTIL